MSGGGAAGDTEQFKLQSRPEQDPDAQTNSPGHGGSGLPEASFAAFC